MTPSPNASTLRQLWESMAKPLKATLLMFTAYTIIQTLVFHSSWAWVHGAFCFILFLAVYRGSEFFRKAMVVLWRINSVVAFIVMAVAVFGLIAVREAVESKAYWGLAAASVYFVYARFNIWRFNHPDVQSWMLHRAAARRGYIAQRSV